MSRSAATFQDALEMMETLPESQQDDVFDILQRRRAEKRREDLAGRAAAARASYEKGDVEQGTADDFLKALDL